MNHVRATFARMGRDVAHEVVVNVFAAVALGAIAFVLMGGRMEDLYTRLRGRAPVSGEVTLLGIDEEALYVWDPTDPEPLVTPRGLLAELVRFLDAAGARVVVLDILTDRPAVGDDLLGLAVAHHGRVVVAERFSPGPPGDPSAFAPASVIADAALAGYANLGLEEQTLFSGEMLVRAVPLVSRVGRSRIAAPFPAGLIGAMQDDDAPVPALALAAAWAARHEGTSVDLGRQLMSACPERACTAGLDALGLPGGPVPLDVPLPLNLRGPEGGDGIPLVPAGRVLRSAGEAALARSLGLDLPVTVPDDLVPLLRDKVVVVGRVDAAASDRFVTAFSFPALQTADMSGARIHAQLIETLVTGRHLRRAPAWLGWALAAGVGAACAATRTRLGSGHLPAWLGVGALLIGAGAAIFLQTDGRVVDVGPALAVLSVVLVGVHLYNRNEEAE